MNSNDNLALALDRLKFYAQDAVCICKPDATLKINGRSYKIEKLLGEGGFSFVYLIRDLSSGRLYALKKILITSGQEGVKEAMREVEAYRRFRHPNIIRILDSAVVQDDGGEGKIIYLCHGVFICVRQQNARAQTPGALPWDMLSYHLPAVNASYPPTREEDPLVGEPVFDHDEELANAEQGELIPYAHRDIKPGNIMIADDGSPILMDFGSTIKARIKVESRQQALLEQDIASEHSSMPYRAPELFDVKTGKTLDEKVDIWALVSLIDAMLVVDPEQRPDIQKVVDMTELALRSST
ncbi:uncharacterized protein I303_103670 [Kwoniella dejecticola CBS 10117]|uniref:non-specific serine/threonine protein kinase n=1 Tax=Kwoniella dejecticola CBS 10117 TaxID=1296121 RepID=A0AAJ8KMI8_9TREE